MSISLLFHNSSCISSDDVVNYLSKNFEKNQPYALISSCQKTGVKNLHFFPLY